MADAALISPHPRAHALYADKRNLTLLTDASSETIVRTVIALGQSMGMTVIAEGIESEQLFASLRDMTCDVGQGYFISRPMPAEQVVEWCRRAPWRIAPLPAGELY